MENWAKILKFPENKPKNEMKSYLALCDNSCIGGTVKQWALVFWNGKHWSTGDFMGEVIYFMKGLPRIPNRKDQDD